MNRRNQPPVVYHVRGPNPNYNPPADPRLSRTTKVLLATAAGLMVAGGLGIAYESGKMKGEAADNAQPQGDRPVATAPATPGMTETAQTPIPTSPTPETTTSDTPFPTESSSASPTAKPKPVDPYAGIRRAAATPYESCDLNSYTNGGTTTVGGHKVTQLHADMLFGANPASDTARTDKHVKTTHSTFILAPIAKDAISEKGWITIKTDSDEQPRHPVFNLPASAKTGAVYVLGLETSATTPGIDGGHNTTTSVAVCGELQNNGDGDWRPPEETLEIPGLTVVDTGTDYPN